MAQREVILLQKVANLGGMGDVVSVRPGFARNYLIPQGRALPATKMNRERFESMKADLEKDNKARKADAEKVAATLEGVSVTIARQASEIGMLYGTIRPRDVTDALQASNGVEIARSKVDFKQPVKELGEHKAHIALHPEVEVIITVEVVRQSNQ